MPKKDSVFLNLEFVICCNMHLLFVTEPFEKSQNNELKTLEILKLQLPDIF